MTNKTCPDCGKQLQSYEMKTHANECLSRGKVKIQRDETISLDLLRQIASKGFEGLNGPPKISWDCPICSEAQNIQSIEEYNSLHLKVCDRCIQKLKKLLKVV